MKAKDFLGREISEGDSVVFVLPHYRELRRGKIVKISPKMLLIECDGSRVRQFHDQVVKIV